MLFTISDLIFLCKCLPLQRGRMISISNMHFTCRCCICQRECITTIGLRAHLRVHETLEISPQNTCTECNTAFASKNHLKRHLKTVHAISMLRSPFSRSTLKELNTIEIVIKMISFIYTVVPIRMRSKNPIAPDSNALKSFFDMNCDVCNTELSSLHHAKLHYHEEHNIHDGYIKVRKFVFIIKVNIHQQIKFYLIQFPFSTFNFEVLSIEIQRHQKY